MGEKRKHESAFHVGPANLPDGTRKRKADRIKQALIDRAKIKQDFEKVKKRKLQEEQDGDAIPRRDVYEDVEEDETRDEAVAAAPHPDRQALIDGPEREEESEDGGDFRRRDRNRRRPRQDPYAKQQAKAQKQKDEADQRRAQREEADRQRQEKIKDREKMQRMIKKAKRPTIDGKRKLGRESEFLLEKVRRLVKG